MPLTDCPWDKLTYRVTILLNRPEMSYFIRFVTNLFEILRQFTPLYFVRNSVININYE